MDIIASEMEKKIEIKDLTARFDDHRKKNTSEFLSPNNKQQKMNLENSQLYNVTLSSDEDEIQNQLISAKLNFHDLAMSPRLKQNENSLFL